MFRGRGSLPNFDGLVNRATEQDPLRIGDKLHDIHSISVALEEVINTSGARILQSCQSLMPRHNKYVHVTEDGTPSERLT